MNIKINKKEGKKIKKENKTNDNKEYTEITLKLNDWLQNTTNCSKIHKPLKSTCFTASNEINRYCEYDSIVFKPFPARFYKRANKK